MVAGSGVVSQTRAMSAWESAVNILVGLSINLLAQILIFPMFGIHIPFTSNMGISVCFTGISLVRSYCIRRWFNGK